VPPYTMGPSMVSRLRKEPPPCMAPSFAYDRGTLRPPLVTCCLLRPHVCVRLGRTLERPSARYRPYSAPSVRPLPPFAFWGSRCWREKVG
jgi:hypothetical protein